MKTGLGTTTYNRPEYFKQCIESFKYVNPDFVCAYNDGSHYELEMNHPEIEYFESPVNKGVATAKNWLLHRMMDEGCDHIYLLEDDITFTGDALSLYLEVADKSGFQHLNFAHHGNANTDRKLYGDQWVEYYPHLVGAFSYYSREVIEKVGYFDDRMKNAYEHVQHTWRIAGAGYTSPFWMFADAANSKSVLQEIPGSIDNSSIRIRDDWDKNTQEALDLWRQQTSECPI